MDFFDPIIHSGRGRMTVQARFRTRPASDFMTRGGAFYAVWNPDACLWSQNEYDVERLVDRAILDMRNGLGEDYGCRLLEDSTSGAWAEYKAWLRNQPDHWTQLDQSLVFQDTPTDIGSFATKRLPYSLVPNGDYSAWDALVSKLYAPEERAKIEWMIGSIVSGDSKWIQKFFVFYGSGGTGKSTILKIIEQLFSGYCAPIQSTNLVSRNDAFVLEALKDNPLVAIDDEGELKSLESNAMLNALTSHATMLMNEKHKSKYPMSFNCMLLISTNQPVRITDSKSGLVRRLIDIIPTGEIFPPDEYFRLMDAISFQLGAIAQHCLEVYLSMGPHYYDRYKPLTMMYGTDAFFNFVEDAYGKFLEQDGTTLTQAYEMYKEYVDDSGLEYKIPKFRFREQLKDYFNDFRPKGWWKNASCRCVYTGFKVDMFESKYDEKHSEDEEPPMSLLEHESLLDLELADCPAQYANDYGTPLTSWDKVTTTLKDLDTNLLHYVLPPIGLVTIDFDLKDASGNKSFRLNAEAAAEFPITYAELSKGGEGIHLEYWYDGDVEQLKNDYSPGIEVKYRKPEGLWALRRRVSFCNKVPIAHISGGLPLKEVGSTLNKKTVDSEKGLRSLIERAIRKEINGCASTAPAVQFIKHILDEAYDSGFEYDVEDMHPAVLSFALKSTHQSAACAKLVSLMKFHSDVEEKRIKFPDEGVVLFFDVEVFPNLFIVCYKELNKPDVVQLINPSPAVIEQLFTYKLIGFNNRRYDNHILYGRLLGFDNAQLFNLSKRIIEGDRTAFFSAAYGASYTDIYDFSTKKQSLKKFEIDLGIHHQELGLPWDAPVPEDLWETVAGYCKNDVCATEAVFKARSEDWAARQILSKLSGLSVNDITSQHMAKILFGDDPCPQSKFIYTDLRTIFPDYEFQNGKTYWKGKEYGEGGLAISDPGIYTNVYLLDIASMHPTSLIALNYFGPYTARFAEFVQSRLAVKHNDLDALERLLGGILIPFVGNDNERKALAYALKICINQVYGLTSAKFENKFRDPRNVDNIVAKRGELFMLSLVEALGKGYWCHVKTDSIKLPDPSPDTVEFVMEYGLEYGYTFELESIYDRLAIVDKANYIAHGHEGEHTGEWTATGKFFDRPYPFKYIFSKEPIGIKDMSEVLGVHKGEGIYILPTEKISEYESTNDSSLLIYVGKIGRFTPVLPGIGGGILLREVDGKFHSVQGTKGFEWMETETLEAREDHACVNEEYYRLQVEECLDRLREVALGDLPRDEVARIFIEGSVAEINEKIGNNLPF